MDAITLQRIQLLHPNIRHEVEGIVEMIHNSGVDIRVTQSMRTFAEQNALYAQGRSQQELNAVGLSKVVAQPTLPKVTQAMGGQSFHNFGLAVDIILFHPTEKTVSYSMTEDMDKDGIPDWHEAVETFTKSGYEWGGNWKFKDTPHFQKTFGLTIIKALDLYNKKAVDEHGFIKF